MENNKSKTSDEPNYKTKSSADDINYINRNTIGVKDLPIETTTSSAVFFLNQYELPTIEGFEFKETEDGNFIEVVKRQKINNNMSYTYNLEPNFNDKIYKEIYGICLDDNGNRVLKLIRTINGKILPAKYVEESFVFDE